eukprot:TRINITY_DN2215_c0_g1_i6.p1 TRINITY_DN2215_c0_g1~~TRINITY_DN2215_c0_g1_i6.p1  ORF type:complete len:265 (-),score=77.18 TRINITY_DN2215_c0_g1_i6:147-941(-)
MDNLDPELRTYFLKVKEDIKQEHKEYLEQHPEIRQILNDFLSSVLLEKPADVHSYARKYFGFFNTVREIPKHKPLVICGPSGVGKGTLIKKLLTEFPNIFELSVSYTTRKPRPGETHGIEYFFVPKEEFEKEIEKGAFLEYCEVHGNYYGTHRSIVEKIISQGKLCILEIDLQGAEKVNKSFMECEYLFIHPKSFEVLKERLKFRGTETPEQIERRLQTAERELNAIKTLDFFKHHVINDNLEECHQQLLDKISQIFAGITFQK